MMFNFNAAEVFKVGVKIEENGKAFYEKALRVVDNPEIKKLFEELALEEVGHKRKFEELLAQLPPRATEATVWDPQNETDLYIKMMADQHVFVGGESIETQVSRLRDVKDALKLAINFEKDSVIFFLTVQDATDETKGREFIGQLVKEEQEHLRRLSLELKKLG
ncbi:MAG: ferritin family protein [Deltaproteobacteria bacterium]|nr:ferritin family protein [Deltaproteobacteria bacterium]